MFGGIFEDTETKKLVRELQDKVSSLEEKFSSINSTASEQKNYIHELQKKVAELENKNLPIKPVCNEIKIVGAKSSDQKLFVIHNNIETKMSVEEIFSDNNFTDLKIVTYKISPDFFNDVVKKFQTATLLIGEKDFNENFDAELFQNPNIEIKITKSELVHDKIFLLSNAEKNFCRVVTGSANFTKAAFGKNFETKNNFETIRVDDSEELYNLYLQRFNFLLNQQSKKYSSKSPTMERTFSDFFTQVSNSNFEKNYFERETGFKYLDNKQKIYPGLYILGGRPGVGKTTFILQILKQLAAQGEHCIFYSYETSEQDLHFKTMSQESFQQCQSSFPITVNHLQKNFMTDDEQVQKLFNSFDANKWDLRILKLTTENVDELLERLQKICDNLKTQDGNPPIVAIDYLQIIPSKFSNDKDGVRFAIDDILKKIKQFQLETNTTFFLISSFGKGKVDDSYITFGSFKESSGIEYTADVVWGLKWKDQEQKNLIEDEIKTTKRQVEFETGIYLEKPSAKFRTYVSNKIFYRVKETAENFSGYYDKENTKQFLFDTEENRDAFVETLTKYYENEKVEQLEKIPMRQMYLSCLKNRQGKTYDACFKFYPEFAYFKSVPMFLKDEKKTSDEDTLN